MDAPRTFSERLLNMREVNFLTQKQMAAELGISAGYLCDLEHGRRKPTVQLVHAICRFLDAVPAQAESWHLAAARADGWEV
jgi:transcriptional regulator with XRE-family HTH domain